MLKKIYISSLFGLSICIIGLYQNCAKPRTYQKIDASGSALASSHDSDLASQSSQLGATLITPTPQGTATTSPNYSMTNPTMPNIQTNKQPSTPAIEQNVVTPLPTFEVVNQNTLVINRNDSTGRKVKADEIKFLNILGQPIGTVDSLQQGGQGFMKVKLVNEMTGRIGYVSVQYDASGTFIGVKGVGSAYYMCYEINTDPCAVVNIPVQFGSKSINCSSPIFYKSAILQGSVNNLKSPKDWQCSGQVWTGGTPF